MAAIAATMLAAAALGMSAIQSREQAQAQKKSMRLQEAAQTRALRERLATQRQTEQAEAKLRAKQPDISSLMSAEQQRALGGPTATMLTGTGGSNSQVRTTTLLGE